jgi:DNA-binding IclR family transcriptional regulator
MKVADKRQAAAASGAGVSGATTRAGRGRPRMAGSEPVGIQAVDIALGVIAELMARQEGMNLSELSRASGLQPSKLHRYLVSLIRHGVLRQSEVTGRYDFGPFARRIGAAAFNRHQGMSLVHEAVSNICAESGCTVYLYIWTELGPTLVRTEMGRDPRALSLREGTALPLCASATGRTFLAYLPAGWTGELLRRERELPAAEGFRAWSDEALDAEAAAIRAHKVFWTTAAILPGPLALVPVLDANRELHSVMAVLPRREHSKPAARRQLNTLLEAQADRLARDLP